MYERTGLLVLGRLLVFGLYPFRASTDRDQRIRKETNTIQCNQIPCWLSPLFWCDTRRDLGELEKLAQDFEKTSL